MSKQIHDEEQRGKQVKFRDSERRIDAFDEAIGDKSRAEAFREFVTRKINDFGPTDGGLDALEPPTDDGDLATAYRVLCDTRNPDHIIPGREAQNRIAVTVAHADQSDAYRLLKLLEDRGYVVLMSSGVAKDRSGKFAVGVNPWYRKGAGA